MNILLAAVLCGGMTVIENCAKEPHIVDLANFLNAMGREGLRRGHRRHKVRGVEAPRRPARIPSFPTRSEAGNLHGRRPRPVGGNVLIENIIPKHLDCITAKLREMGARVTEYDDSIRVESTKRLRRANVKTLPYPGFPTDMQPQIAVAMALAEGTSLVTEGIYDNRFRYTGELNRMARPSRSRAKQR